MHRAINLIFAWHARNIPVELVLLLQLNVHLVQTSLPELRHTLITEKHVEPVGCYDCKRHPSSYFSMVFYCAKLTWDSANI